MYYIVFKNFLADLSLNAFLLNTNNYLNFKNIRQLVKHPRFSKGAFLAGNMNQDGLESHKLKSIDFRKAWFDNNA